MAFGWFDKKEGAALSPSGKEIVISSLLTPELVLTCPQGLGKEAFIATLVERLCRVRKLGDSELILKRVLERESGISTTLDTGLAVPHARLDGIGQIAAALGLIPHGIPDPNQPDYTIRAVFLFFSPNNPENFTRHLQLLRSVSGLFQADLIEALLVPADEAGVLNLIRSRELEA